MHAFICCIFLLCKSSVRALNIIFFWISAVLLWFDRELSFHELHQIRRRNAVESTANEIIDLLYSLKSEPEAGNKTSENDKSILTHFIFVVCDDK